MHKEMDTNKVNENQSIFALGEKFNNKNFTGDVWLKMLVDRDNDFNCPIGNVTFAPGCRNSWHKHFGGQILLVTSGEGYYQEEGKEIRLLHTGDVVLIEPNVKHWHGATPYSYFSHLSIETNIEKGGAVWLEPVSDSDYYSYKADSTKYLQDKDPEFNAFFEEFANKEVQNYVKLDQKTKYMTILASVIANQGLAEYKFMLEKSLNAGVSPIEIKEMVYQAVAYLGISKVYDFMIATNECFLSKGISLPLEGQSTTNKDNRKDKGLLKQKEAFGKKNIDDMYKNSSKDELHIQVFLSDNCFGDYYTRKAIDLKQRELLTFSMLLSLGGVEPQLKGHIQGNLNVGNTKEILLSVITLLIPYNGYPKTLNAIRCLNDVAK
jgi:4-carboxymuconolactone decarboxylase